MKLKDISDLIRPEILQITGAFLPGVVPNG
jgi:hypothetical protein